MASKGDAPPFGGPGKTEEPVGTAERIPLAEERATIDKRVVERLGARVHLRTHEEEVPYTETLRRESVEVKRVPVNEIVETVPASREGDGVLIVPIVEEVLVKRFRVVEELHIHTRNETVEVSDAVTLRRQEAIVDDAPADVAPPTSASRNGDPA